jgi:hypothetical protein
MGDRYRIAPPVLRAELEGDQVLLNPETGIYHLVNDTGSSILGLLADGLDLHEGVTRLSRETGEPIERVSRDAEAFVAAMVERRLLEPIG